MKMPGHVLLGRLKASIAVPSRNEQDCIWIVIQDVKQEVCPHQVELLVFTKISSPQRPYIDTKRRAKG